MGPFCSKIMFDSVLLCLSGMFIQYSPCLAPSTIQRYCFPKIMNRAIVVHKKPDDLSVEGDGLGNAGDRIGCCVITAGCKIKAPPPTFKMFLKVSPGGRQSWIFFCLFNFSLSLYCSALDNSATAPPPFHLLRL